MATVSIGALAPGEPTIVMDVDTTTAAEVHHDTASKSTGLHSPPDSNNAMKLDGSDSELSDIEDEIAEQFLKLEEEFEEAFQPTQAPPPAPEPEVPEDIGEVVPDHYSGTVPVFKPTMKQFKDFKLFMEKVDCYGMKSGIIKIIPPQEWKDAQPELSELVKPIKVREPIKQDIMGSNGTYRQVNILHQRSYNLPQWRQLCDQSEHQPPARRGERRANVEKPKAPSRRRAPAGSAGPAASPAPRKLRGRASRRSKGTGTEASEDTDGRPMTPVSPKAEEEEIVESIEQDPGEDDEGDSTPIVRRMGMVSAKPKTQSTSARRKYSRREASAKIDEAAFKDWDYRMDVSDYTPERCEELERIYWKTLTYAPPLYGADLPGTLFDERTDIWNLNKLPNLLDVMGTKIPGVNTAYLYLGMWKATFAWHLEDVDLYSINYLHFGAPKQWYSISQGDARRFEAAMKSIWPTDAKACDQFLRHKAFLISPTHLLQHFNIKVNKVVSYPGEFVVTYPYGYHSGYNLGYNCAEAVNFALDTWLPMGKIAKKCECAQAQDSVWIDVYEIERKLRGEETEYEETEDEDEDDEDDEEETGLLSPPAGHAVRVRLPGRKRKRPAGEKDGKKTKKIRLRIKSHHEPPCCLCPNDIPGAEILPTDDGRKAHRMCALYLPETYIETVDDKEVVTNVSNINKARLELKCLYCRSKKGACFQCSQKKCARSYHATCAAAAGVFVEEEEVPVFGEDGTEYKEQAFEFSCRFHRTKRDRKLDGDALEESTKTFQAASALKKGDFCQMQYYRSDIFAGVVVENRPDERALLLDVIPHGDRVEVDWKWLLLPDAADFRLPKASPNALPLPTSRKAKQEIKAKRSMDEPPRKDDEFCEGFTWAEYNLGTATKNSAQIPVDFDKENHLWHYIGKTSTETKAQYTGDLAVWQHNPKSNFLDTVPKPTRAAPASVLMPPPSRPSLGGPAPRQQPGSTSTAKQEKPYVYKPRKSSQSGGNSAQRLAATAAANQRYPSTQAGQLSGPDNRQLPFGTDTRFKGTSTTSLYSSDRFAPVGGCNGFPTVPGLTWPPAHMKSGLHFQQASRAWSASSGGAFSESRPSVPMTTSSLTSHGAAQEATGERDSAVVEPQMNAFQKYSYFQTHHNREPARYRTPYALWGGFTNGYEGNLRAFLQKAQLSLSGKTGASGSPLQQQHQHRKTTSISSISLPPAPSPGHQATAAMRPPTGPLPAWYKASKADQMDSTSSLSPRGHDAYGKAPMTVASFDYKPSAVSLHPAIRPPYGKAAHQKKNSLSKTAPSRTAQGRSTSSQLPTSAPVFKKQSHTPIPLPPYVRASMSSAASRPSPLSANFTPPPTASPLAHKTVLSAPDPMQHPSPLFGPSQNLSLPQMPHDRWSPQRFPSPQMTGFMTSRPISDFSTPPPMPPFVKEEPSFYHSSPHMTQPSPLSAMFDSQPTISPADLHHNVHDFPDVPSDSMALVERMMLNLRKASENRSPSF